MIRLMSAVVLTASLLGMAACAPAPPAAPPPIDTAADEAAIRATTTTWIDAYNAGDVETLVALYAEDGVLMPPHAPVATGRAAIRAFATADTAGAKAAGVKLVLAPNPWVSVSGDMASESGTFTATDATGATVDSGSYLSSRKIDGKWLYIRDMYNSDRPLPAAPTPAK